MNADWFPPVAAGIGASVVSWIGAWKISSARFEAKYEAESKARDEQNSVQQKAAEDRHHEIQTTLKEMREDSRVCMTRVGDLADRAASMQSSQNVVNSVTAKALDAIIAKQDQHADKLTDHASTLKLVTGMVAMMQSRMDGMDRLYDGQDKRVGFEK